MNIKQLIASTNKVKGRDQASVFQKKFGSIYAYNKNVTIFKGGNAIIISMMIGGVTDMIKMGGKRVPVPYHKVAIALNIGPEGRKDYSPEELVAVIRLKHSKYANVEEYPAGDVLREVLNNPDKFFEDSTVFKTTNGSGYTVITNNISEDSEVQVWCSCSDYYWTFQYYNAQTKDKNGASTNLYGSSSYPKTYSYKSEAGKKSKRPLRNPGRNPGMCKHLMLLMGMLMEDELIADPKNGLKKYYKANYAGFLQNKEKDRINQSTYERMVKKYEKGHKVMMDQRNFAHFVRGDKIERKFNWKTGNFTTRKKRG